MNKKQLKKMVEKCVYSEDGITYMSDKQYNDYMKLIETLKETNKLLLKQKGQLQEDLDMLDNRVFKAIDYINENSKNELIEEVKHFAFFKRKIKYVDISKLLEILKGGSNE